MIAVEPKDPHEMAEDIKALAAILLIAKLRHPNESAVWLKALERLMPDAAPRAREWLEALGE